MTKLLLTAFQRASELSDELQDQLAQELLEQLEAEFEWDSKLENTQNKLEQLADEALRDHREDKTQEMGFDEL
jgi:hypothetical protein